MSEQRGTPRRSPRGHQGSYPRRFDDDGSGFNTARALYADEDAYGESTRHSGERSNGLSSPEVDRECLEGTGKNGDDFPSPPPPLSNPSSTSGEEASHSRNSNASVPQAASYNPRPRPSRPTHAFHMRHPNTRAPIVQPSSGYAHTNPVSLTPSDRTALLPSVPTTQPLSTPTGYHPSTCTPINPLSSTHAPVNRPTPSDPRRSDGVTSQHAEEAIEREEIIDLVDVDRLNGPAQAESQKALQRLFVYLNRLTVNQQKSVASAFNVVQQGNKKVRASRMFVVISGIMERKGKTAMELLEEKGVEKGKDLKSDYERILRIWGDKEEATVIPPIAELEAEGGVRQHPVQDGNGAIPIDDESDDGDENPLHDSVRDNLTLEEFARLMVLFRDVPEAADDLRKSGQDLQREDLDIRANNRHAFWTDRIQPLFNDPTFLTNEQFDDALSHIDPGRPVTTFRSGVCLQNLFAKFRKEFTEVYRNWDVSGNNDSSTFINFCRVKHQTTLSRPGARCLIAWKVFRFGTDTQNSLILDFCTKQIAAASGADLESGLGEGNQDGANGRRKRNSLSKSPGEVNDALFGALQTLSNHGTDANVSKKQRVALDDLAIKNARLENERSIMNNIAEAHKLASQISSDMPQHNRITNIIQAYCGKLADDMESTVRDRGSVQ